jgi:hypothetical protein
VQIKFNSEIFVNFEPFCGNTKPVERPESSICREEAQKNAKKKWLVTRR